MCPDARDAVCCPDGTHFCTASEFECRPRSICESPPAIVLLAPGAPCTADEECQGPIDTRCGATLCKEGTCRFEIAAGEKIKSQYPGDCQDNICNFQGDVERIPAANDFPFDDNPCTQDFCEGTETINQVLTDGSPVPGSPTEICVLGRRQECSEPLGLQWLCKKPGESCDWDRCNLSECNNKMPSVGETDVDCGGPNCTPCLDGWGCDKGSDCMSSVCAGHLCQKPTHSDGVKNADETGIDCGYPGAPFFLCKDGEACNSQFACASQVCWGGICQLPSCTDDRQNGTEEDNDCGGSCPPCPPKTH